MEQPPFSPVLAWVIIVAMVRFLNLTILIVLLVLPACAQGTITPPVVSTPDQTPTVEVEDEITPRVTEEVQPSNETDQQPAQLPTADHPVTIPSTRYQLDVTFDYAARRASIEQTIDYANATSIALDDLLIKVEPVNYPGVFSLEKLAWADSEEISGERWDGAILTIPLPEPLLPGSVRSISITYGLAMPRMIEDSNLRPPIFGYTDRQVNMVDWYPFIPPYTDEGWMVYPRGYYGEHLTYESADYEINLRLLNAPDNLVVAASSAATVDGDWRRYRLSNARNFVFSLSPGYEVLEGQAGNIAVYSYAFQVFRSANAAVLQTTIDSLLLYQELFGDYPHQTLSAVQGDFMDGMEYDGLYYLSKAFYNIYSDTPTDYLIAIAAHETAHQWWYALVGNNQAEEPWLDEALCTYMEHIYYERYAPEALDWWWQYRINYYEPRGLIDVSIYDQHGEFQSYRDYRDAVYLNGAVFLHELRTTIGDDAFFAFLRDYAARHAGGIATRQSFFAVLAEHTSLDLSALIAKYFQ